MTQLTLSILPDSYAICRLEPGSGLPAWAESNPFNAVVRTPDELSIVCVQRAVPAGVRAERNWRVLKVDGPLDFSLTGILANLAGALAAADISLFAVSTYDTDYLLVKAADLERTRIALRDEGHKIGV